MHLGGVIWRSSADIYPTKIQQRVPEPQKDKKEAGHREDEKYKH